MFCHDFVSLALKSAEIGLLCMYEFMYVHAYSQVPEQTLKTLHRLKLSDSDLSTGSRLYGF